MSGKKNSQAKPVNQQKSTRSGPSQPVAPKVASRSSFASGLQNSEKRFLYQKICIFLVAFLVFANSIPNGFNMDDEFYTMPNHPVSTRGIKAIPDIFTAHTFQGKNFNFDYRPFAMLSFALQHQFLGSHPYTSHFISVLLYAFICLLIFILLCRWLGDPLSWFAFFVALLYVVHPLHTEVVCNIKCRDELMATLLSLIALLHIWKWHQTGKNRYLAYCISLFFIALLCKNTAFFYIPVVPATFYFFSDMPVKKILRPFILMLLASLAIGIFIAVFLPQDNRIFEFYENPLYTTHVPLLVKSATATYVLGWYMLLHVIPYPLSFYYGHEYVPLVSWTNLMAVLSLVVHLLLAYVVVRNFRKGNILAFGGLLYLAFILPYSNFFFPSPGIMADRFTFASTFGYCIIVVVLLYRLFKIALPAFPSGAKTKYLGTTLALILIGYGGMSIERNTQWKSSWVLYNHDIQHLQNSAKANLLYGQEVIRKTDFFRLQITQSPGLAGKAYMDSLAQYQPEEKKAFLRALATAPGNSKILNNLAVAYVHEDSFEKAKQCLLQVTAMTPHDADVHYNLGMVYTRLSKQRASAAFRDTAIFEFNEVIRFNPGYTAAYDELSQAYLLNKDTAKAIALLEKGTRNISQSSFLYIKAARVYLATRDTITAMSYYEKAAAVPDPDPVLLPFLQSYYHQHGDAKKESYYRNREQEINSRTKESE